MKIHPYADQFPMRPQEELEHLARSIKENGQRLPITLDVDDVLLDGRNRLAACELAGVEPAFVTLPADKDPIAFIVDMNLDRRDLLKSQHAMLYAIAYPEPTPREGRSNAPTEAGIPGIPAVSKALISFARTVLREFGHDSDEVKRVVAGESLKEVYNWVLARQKAQAEFEAAQEQERQAAAQAERDLVEAQQAFELLQRRTDVTRRVAEAVKWMHETYTVHPHFAQMPLHSCYDDHRLTDEDIADEWLDYIDDATAMPEVLTSHVILVDREGRILSDIRQLIACKLLGCEPRFQTLDMDDQAAIRWVFRWECSTGWTWAKRQELNALKRQHDETAPGEAKERLWDAMVALMSEAREKNWANQQAMDAWEDEVATTAEEEKTS